MLSPICSVHVAKESFKVSAARFVAREGFCGALHGHNYTVSIRLHGPVGDDGYVVDFGMIKQIAKSHCGGLDGKTLISSSGVSPSHMANAPGCA